jgi:hypothetical protein
MYKRRFEAWGIGKYLKAHAALAMLHSKIDRDAIARSSDFVFRGQRVDEVRLQRHLKRNPLYLEQQMSTPPLELANHHNRKYTKQPSRKAQAVASPQSQETVARAFRRDACLRCEILRLPVS